jgi:hypothetical protein
MKVKSKTSLLLLLLAGIPLLAGGIYFIYNTMIPDARQAIEAVPPDASMVFITDKPGEVWKKLSTESAVWNTLSKTENFRRLGNTVKIIDSAIRRHSDIDKLLKGKRLLISLHNLKPDENEFLFMLELPPTFISIGGSHVLEKYGQAALIEEKEFYGVHCRKVVFGNTKISIWYAMHRGLFIASYSPLLLQRAIQQADSDTPLSEDEGFKRLSLAAGKSVDANIYIHFPRFPGVLNEFSAKGFAPGFSRLGNFARWAQLDLFISQKKIMLGGYTWASGSDFLKLFKDQEPALPTALNLLPAQTASFAYLCFKNFSSFVANYNNYLSQAKKTSPAGNAVKMLDVSTSENLKEAVVSEIAVALVNGEMNTAAANSFVIIHSLAPEKFDRMLDETLASDDDKILMIQDNKLKKANFSMFFDSFLYNVFPDFEITYYYTIGEYFIFCPSPENLNKFILNYISGQTLVNDPGFAALNQNLAEKSNILLYYNPSKSASFHHFLFKDETAGKFDSNLPALDALEGVSLQFSGGGDLFYTTMLLQNKEVENSNERNTNLPDILSDTDSSSSGGYETSQADTSAIEANPDARWTTLLNAPVFGKPWFFQEKTDSKTLIIAFDQRARMYLINNLGGIETEVQLNELPVSEVFTGQFAGRGKNTFLFSTKTLLYQFQSDGKPVKGFPVKLPEKASNGISVIFSDNNKEPKLLVAGESNIIYCLDKMGKSVTKWNKPKASTGVIQPIRYLKSKEGNYIIIPQKNGKVLMTNLKGEPLISLEESFTNANNSEFYINQTNGKGLMLTTDDKGNLLYISSKGPVEKTVFDNFSKNHYFVYEDFDGNGSPDFIYLDLTNLVVYNKVKKVLLQHTFAQPVTGKPVVFNLPGQGNLLGVVSQATDEIFIFGKDGLFLPTPFKGNTPFVTGVLETGETTALITGYKSSVICYSLLKENEPEE